MLTMFRRFATVGSVVAFVRSPTGQRLTAKAKAYYQDPRTQQRIAEVRRKLFPSR